MFKHMLSMQLKDIIEVVYDFYKSFCVSLVSVMTILYIMTKIGQMLG